MRELGRDVQDQADKIKPEVADQADLGRRIQSAENYKPERVGDAADKALPDVRGFERSDVMTNEEVEQYLADTFPPEHVDREALKRIEYVDMYVPHQEGGNILGVTDYNILTDSSTIEVYRQEPDGSLDRSQMEHTIAHEVAHSAYFDMGWHGGSVRQLAWTELSANSPPDGYVSEYATVSPEEDFAETYATYVNDPELLLEVNRDKYNFMRDHIFHGREYR